MPAMSRACIRDGWESDRKRLKFFATNSGLLPGGQALEMDEGYPDELEGLKLVKSDTAESGYKVFMHVCAVWTEVWGHSEQSFTFQNGCHSHHSGENDVAA